jgi:hypothetical protein
MLGGEIGDALHILEAEHIGCDGACVSAFAPDFVNERSEPSLSARGSHDTRAARREPQGRLTPDAARCSDDDYHLLADWL